MSETFDEFCNRHRLTASEREAAWVFLLVFRALRLQPDAVVAAFGAALAKGVR